MIELHISRQTLTLPRTLASKVQLVASHRPHLGDQTAEDIDNHLGPQSHTQTTIHESTLDRMVVKYSEQLVFQPRREIQHWFAYGSGAYLDPGYPPLFYFPNTESKLQPNKSVVAGIGEAIAGFLAQKYFRCQKLARPNNEFPDIVMESGNETFLVEAKATIKQTSTVSKLITANRMEFIARTAISGGCDDSRPLRGLLVATKIESDNLYCCECLEVKFVP